tara:strand:- start:2313 stop:2639 length:327 start_codon:yes stop_codon:yes gene_type:complete
MAPTSLSEQVKDAVSDDGVRKVEVEITHKHENGSKGTTWALVLGVLLLVGITMFFVADSSGGLLSGDDSVIGDCADGKDNDGDNLVDAQDPGCRPNGIYDEEGFERSA